MSNVSRSYCLNIGESIMYNNRILTGIMYDIILLST